MKFTWKDSFFIAGLTASLVLAGTKGSHAARPPMQESYMSVSDGLNAPEDLGYDVLLRNQLVATLAPAGGEALPPPVPQKLLVFFETAKTDLCPDAKLIVREAAAEVQRDNPKDVPKDMTVIQVTDSSGKTDNNPNLAQERAQVVRDELVRLGVPQDQIAVTRKEPPPVQGRKVAIVYE